jgi:hypothetical protein
MFHASRLSLCALAACSLLALSCGSDDDGSGSESQDRAAVAAVAQSYLTAIANLDAGGVCNSLTKEAQQQAVAQSGSSETKCVNVFRLGFAALSDEQKQVLAGQRDLEPLNIQVRGDTATGQFQYRGQTSRFTAAKVDGEWKLSSPGEAELIAEP